MSHVLQINSLVRWKHSFLHSPKRLAPNISWLVCNWKHLENSFKQHVQRFWAKDTRLSETSSAKKLEKHPSSAAGFSQWHNQVTTMKITSTYFVHLLYTQLKNYQKPLGSFLIRPFWKRLANLCVTLCIVWVQTPEYNFLDSSRSWVFFNVCEVKDIMHF